MKVQIFERPILVPAPAKSNIERYLPSIIHFPASVLSIIPQRAEIIKELLPQLFRKKPSKFSK